MLQLQDVRDNLTELLGMKPKSPMDRLRAMDWRDLDPRSLGSHLPSMSQVRRSLPSQRGFDLDATALLIGIGVGIGLGFGLAYALKGNVKPAVNRARQAAKSTAARLNITRMEETGASR